MVLWIGVDDTDSLRGMCTTFLATEIVRELLQDYDLIGFPRLVRLNPNIPWKTRGNAAVCLRVGRGGGTPHVVGRIDGRVVRSFPSGNSEMDPSEIERTVGAVVERWSCFEDATTNPAFAILRSPPSPRLYWEAVRGIVPIAKAVRAARGLGVLRRYKRGRGAVGALAAIAWRPRDRTYEVLAYRNPSRWGLPREVDPKSVREMDSRFPSTFNNYDYENSRVVIAPHSPCPILFGIRGDDPTDLYPAMRRIRGERPDRWLLFETNQGTDDHVIDSRTLVPSATVRMTGKVAQPARTLAGGHVVFQMDSLDVTAYEPSKQFRRIIRALAIGDRVRVVGAVRKSPQTLNLEKLEVLALAKVVRKVSNPWCPDCRKRAKSLGQRAGYRCSRCGVRFPSGSATMVRIPRTLSKGWYEPPVGSRRHLSKPLKRFS